MANQKLGDAPLQSALDEKSGRLALTKAPLRLLLLNYEFPPIGGGAGSATYYMARDLYNRGHQVDVLTSQYIGCKSYENVDGVRVFRVPSYRVGIHDAGVRGAASFLFYARIKLAQLIRENNYDLLHYYFGLPTGLLASYSYGKCGIPYIVSLRGSDVPGYDNDSAPRIHSLLGPVRQWIWNNAAAVIANSSSLRDIALTTDPTCEIGVIHNGVCTQRFKPNQYRYRTEGPLRVLCVSRLVRRKGLDTLIRAIAELRDTNVVLELVGEGRIESELRELVQSLGIQENVKFCGFVTQSDLPEYHRRADIFVLPSLSESCAMALLEAMSSGLPVIASNAGGNTEIVRHNQNGLLFNPGSITGLTAALRELATSPDLRAKFSRNNPKKILSQHAWAEISRQYEDLYLQSMAASSQRSQLKVRPRHA